MNSSKVIFFQKFFLNFKFASFIESLTFERLYLQLEIYPDEHLQITILESS